MVARSTNVAKKLTAKRKLTTHVFDYSEFDEATKSKLIYRAGQINKHWSIGIKANLLAAEELYEANNLLAEAGCKGRFSEWLRVSCNCSRSTAYSWIAVWREFANCPALDSLRPAVLIELSKRTTPEAARKDARKLAKKGVPVTIETARQLIEKHTVESVDDDEEFDHEETDTGSKADAGQEGQEESAEAPRDSASDDGGEGKPTPTVITSPDWRKVRAKVKASVEQLMRDIDELNGIKPIKRHELLIVDCREIVMELQAIK